MTTASAQKTGQDSSALFGQVKQKVPSLKAKYDNWIGGKYVPPVDGQYFDTISPLTGKAYSKAARSNAKDVEKAIDAAQAAFESWSRTSAAERSQILNKIADRVEQNLEMLATIETWDNGKPIREAMAGDLAMVIDHFRYFAAACRTEDSTISQIDDNTVAYHYNEPLGVVAAIIPWNFPLTLLSWKCAPALAAGNTVVLKPAEQTPVSTMVFMELVADILPPGVINIVQGFGPEAGKPLAESPRVGKVTFTGETTTGKLISQYAGQNLVPVTLELGGKSPNIFFSDLFDKDDDLLDKAAEGFTMFALVKGEICTCPSRALIHEKIYDKFMDRVMKRIEKIVVGNPLELTTMMGPQNSSEQLKKIMSYMDIGKQEGAKILTGGVQPKMQGELSGGYFFSPTVFKGSNSMRVFQEEIFGPVVSVTTFKDDDEAIRLANDTKYGLAAAIWTRDVNRAYRASRAIKAGRVWVNAYHMYPTHSAFGGYKQSGIGRENHRMMLAHFQQTKNVLVSYSPKALGFF